MYSLIFATTVRDSFVRVSRLFAKESTEYDLLADLQKSFEPYCDLWKRVDDWMSWHKGWMNDSFLSLDAEEVCCWNILSTL